MLNRLYNDRTSKGLLVYHRLDEAMDQVQRAPQCGARLLRGRRRLARAAWASPTAGSASRSAWPDTLGEELRKLASAIGNGAEAIEAEEQRIELIAAARPLRRRWQRRSRPGSSRSSPTSVYWIEVEPDDRGGGSPWPRRPLDVGPTLRRELFDRVPTCVLTSATLSVGSPPRFDFRQGAARADRVRDACSSAARSTTPARSRSTCRENLPDPSEQGSRIRAAGDPGDPPLPRADARQGVRPVHVVRMMEAAVAR